MNLKQARSQVLINLTQPFADKYRIYSDVIDNTLLRIYDDLALGTQMLQRNFTITTVANQASYDLDSDMALILRVYYDYDSTSGSADYGDEVEEVSYRELEGTAEYGKPTQYWVEGLHHGASGKSKIWFNPIPDTASLTIRILAIEYPDLISANTDTFNFKRGVDLALIQGATAELGAIGEGIPNLAYFVSNYNARKGELRKLVRSGSPGRSYRTRYRETWD